MTVKILFSSGKEIELTGQELKELYGNGYFEMQKITTYPAYPTYPVYPYPYPITTCKADTTESQGGN